MAKRKCLNELICIYDCGDFPWWVSSRTVERVALKSIKSQKIKLISHFHEESCVCARALCLALKKHHYYHMYYHISALQYIAI